MLRTTSVVLAALLLTSMARADFEVGTITDLAFAKGGKSGVVTLTYPSGATVEYTVTPSTVVLDFDQHIAFTDLQIGWPAYVAATSGRVATRIVAHPYVP